MSEIQPTSECEAIQAEMGALLDGELAAAAQKVVERHLESCAACSEELALLRLVAQSLSLAPRPEPSETMRQRLLAEVAADLAPRRMDMVCTERHGDRVVQWREVLTIREPASAPWPAVEPIVVAPALILQSRREQAIRPGVYQVIESYLGR